MKLLLGALLSAALVASVCGSALWDYVNNDDNHYSYFDTGYRYFNQSGWKGYMLNITSQQWLPSSQVSISVWTHQFLVVVPDTVQFNGFGAIYVTGSSNPSPNPANDDEDVLVCAALATSTGTACGVLWQVPNQPIVFSSDPLHQERSEDALVGFTWLHYILNTTDPNWIAYFPMVKSVVRAMDTLQDYTSKNFGLDIKKIMITGASKRGWTTWLTGTLNDPRVMGIAPIVMDMLNFVPNVQHMYKAYDGWTFAFYDYWVLNITEYLIQPEIYELAAIIDPLAYKANLTIPKLVIDATGDEFFMPDDDYFWWGTLPGETLRLMIQNAEHSMATGAIELIIGLEAWYAALITDTPRPVFSWTIANNTGDINLVSKTQPESVVMYFATTYGSYRRDFRLIKGNTPADPCTFIPISVFGNACINPVIWLPESLAPTQVDSEGYHYLLTQPLPQAGWRGFLALLTFPGPLNTSYQLTTQVSIIPQTFPFAMCTTPEQCIGNLV